MSKKVNKHITTRMVTITPAMATEMLKRNSANRKIRPLVVERYAADIRQGQWKESHQGIAFDWNNVLVDGQHRLKAIEVADTPVRMSVTYNLPPDSRLVVDEHAARRPADSLSFGPLGEVTSAEAAICRTMVSPSRNPGFSRPTLAKHFRANKEAIRFAYDLYRECKSIPGLRAAPVWAVVGRAWTSQNKTKLREFGQVLSTGMTSSKKHQTIIMLRDYLMGTTNYRGAKDGSTAFMRYRKTETALWHFLNDKPLTKLYPASRELFQIGNVSDSNTFSAESEDEQEQMAASA